MTSLPEICKLFEIFGAISYYKVNISKCQILTININHTIRTKMKSIFSCNWDNNKIQYLGIYLTAKSNQLYEANYKKLLQSVQTELMHMSKFEISWMGRIASFKMMVLPKILYIFRTVPIPLPTFFFNKLNTSLRSFIWKGLRPRIAFSTLMKQRSKGGMGVPIIKNDYRATLLDQLKAWFDPSSRKQ